MSLAASTFLASTNRRPARIKVPGECGICDTSLAVMKPSRQSAGLLMYRGARDELQVLLVHPGGPFWAHRHEGAWTLPKGEYAGNEEALAAACREFREETGFAVSGPFLELGSIRQKGGKVVTAWAFAGDADATLLVSNTCEIEWPPRSGKRLVIPEIDRGEWFDVKTARTVLREEQHAFLNRLEDLLRELR